ncbi:Ig-like domain-containing protein, partial [Acinetobacter sp. MD2(2019)]|uniref:Ig-like domain-containing protein n=1 Tax=Acinetobacter sp. MD2(2019) TaxID=2605273 RepID=UPI002D1F5AED
MANIEVTAKKSHKVLSKSGGDKVSLTEDSVIKIGVSKTMVESITRDGNAAVVTLKNGETITIENYFTNTPEANSIVFDDNGSLAWAKFTDASGNVVSTVTYNPLADISPLLYSESQVAIVPWLIGAGLAGGVIAVAAGGSDSDNKKSGSSTPDTTAPNPVTDAKFSEDGSSVTGKGEPGATVTIKDKDGNVIGTGTADKDGNITIPIQPPLTNGETVTITQKDPAGNESTPINVIAPDTTPPDAPTAEFNDDGTEVTGKGEPGATVTIKDQDGNVIGTGVVDSDGNFTIPVQPPLTNGETA